MYGKLFTSMYDGTLGTEGPWQALVTFQQMVILADREGVVDMTAGALARRTNIPLEIIEAGIAALLKPDPKSRSEAEEGRRIAPIEEHRDWGWRLVNYEHYRKMRSAEERREYLRLAQQRRRERLKQEPSTNVNTSTAGTQSQPIAVSSKQYAVSSKAEQLASSPRKRGSLPAIGEGNLIVAIPAIGGEVEVRESAAVEWKATYPSLDIPATLREIRAWVLANPTKRKSNAHRFIVNWLKREQDRG